MKLKDMPARLNCDVLITAVERGDQVMIPDGNFELHAKDAVTILGTQARTLQFFKKLGKIILMKPGQLCQI